MKAKVGNPARKLVLIKLADNANDDGICWPSYQNIADHCEITKRSAMSHISKLEAMGLVARRYRKSDDGRKNKSNYYHLTLDSENISPPSENISPPPSENISPRTSHSLEPVIEPNNIDRAFDIFWSAGMKKVAKPKAITAFKKALKDSGFKDPLAFANHLTSDIRVRQASGQFGFDKMHPTTYLNQQRWNDDYEANQQTDTTQGRKLTAVEENNRRLLEKYADTATPSEREINPDEHPRMDKHQGSGSVRPQVESHGITIDMDSGYIGDDGGADTDIHF